MITKGNEMIRELMILLDKRNAALKAKEHDSYIVRIDDSIIMKFNDFVKMHHKMVNDISEALKCEK